MDTNLQTGYPMTFLLYALSILTFFFFKDLFFEGGRRRDRRRENLKLSMEHNGGGLNPTTPNS